MVLNDDDLYKKHDQLVNLKRQTYEKIFNRCVNTIKLSSDAGELICLFQIPNFLFGTGYPIVNIKYCANYIINKLSEMNENIETTFIDPNILFIDWRKKPNKQPKTTHHFSTNSSEYKSRKSKH
ncbi:hypothetical protein [Acanthamoeba castellanii mimivirus]|uniref:Uncharacterized protein R447 n=5 Tax=Mimivirus TaxID=315393 RepID=YR447_MIMIV|nr:hypothetical protein MIMI_gp0480 [Acanthamoeba polyphaga mimivirus]Q5UQP1.1 RecName: Full=Uncharacterized protein R447 [Acanthamoeba polyphaga mimivirus]AEQ60633.1 hypothetical protein [Acanthamoeba castellanii mamavirus]AHA45412.1 hypothetical protein HIRU_S506 [Hirudovirus strain Sangsue]AHJ40132.1 hypothetical protein [Samba virus]ALR84037.1 hypothetical protein [Niemeyer virus]AMZ02891.1 hypothetical protein [Mimivirus Bombay]EJN40883.1 hypothetical protein lvs_R379 [Acanthamoeba poly